MSDQDVVIKGPTYNPAPEGVWQAVCCDFLVAYQVERTNPKNNEKYVRDEITFIFQITEINPETNKRYLIRHNVGMNLTPQGKLKPFLEAWRGKKFEKAELDQGFKPSKLIGANCLLNIVHNGAWANINSVMPLPKNQAQIAVDNYQRKTNDVPTHSGQPEMEASSAPEIETDIVPF